MVIKDHLLTGVVVGVIFPVFCFGILYLLMHLLGQFLPFYAHYSFTKLMFASTALNVIPAKYFYSKKNMIRTAQGVLLITVCLIVTIVVLF
jgi:hypothetical protein